MSEANSRSSPRYMDTMLPRNNAILTRLDLLTNKTTYISINKGQLSDQCILPKLRSNQFFQNSTNLVFIYQKRSNTMEFMAACKLHEVEKGLAAISPVNNMQFSSDPWSDGHKYILIPAPNQFNSTDGVWVLFYGNYDQPDTHQTLLFPSREKIEQYRLAYPNRYHNSYINHHYFDNYVLTSTKYEPLNDNIPQEGSQSSTPNDLTDEHDS